MVLPHPGSPARNLPQSSALCLLDLLMVVCQSQMLAVRLGASATAGPQQHHPFLLLLWLP